jgi:hypothetical protein
MGRPFFCNDDRKALMEPTLRKGTTPSSVLQRMLTLKLKMGTESDLGGLYRYFVENLGGNDEFLRLGVETRRPQIVQRVTEIAGSIFQERALSLQRSRMVRIVEGRFTHGSLIFQEQVATFFYFEEIDSGLAVFLVPPFVAETKELARFSLRRLQEDGG